MAVSSGRGVEPRSTKYVLGSPDIASHFQTSGNLQNQDFMVHEDQLEKVGPTAVDRKNCEQNWDHNDAGFV